MGKLSPALRALEIVCTVELGLRPVLALVGGRMRSSARTRTESPSTVGSVVRGGWSRTGHIRERSPGSVELRYSLGNDPATARRKIATATVHGSRKEAEKEMRPLLRALDTGEHVDPNRITVREWLKILLYAIRREVAPRTAERYAEIVNGFSCPSVRQFATLQACANASPGCAQSMGGWWSARRQRRRPVTPHSAPHPSHPRRRCPTAANCAQPL